MKVQASVKKRCPKCKIVKEKVELLLFVKIQNINKDKVNKKEDIKWHVLKV